MKKTFMLPPGRFVYAMLLACALVLPGFTGYAVVTTHDIAASFKGYSIEKVPGANEFVAVGTIYADGNLNAMTGYHFMHLDGSGNVLQSWYRYPQGGWQLRVVDVAVEDADNYWVVMAARDNTRLYDFCYAEKVSLMAGGVSGTWPWELSIGNLNDPSFPYLYPSHSVYNYGHLYVCGYVSDRFGPNVPSATSQQKQGMMSVTDVTTFTNPPGVIPTTTLALWESQTPTGTGNDYDMALRIRDDGDHLYVTGAGNTPPPGLQSGTIFIHFTTVGLGTIGTPSVNYLAASGSSPIQGTHGIDVLQTNSDVYVLTSRFDYADMISWGIMRLDLATGLPGGSPADYLHCNSGNGSEEWPKQFLPHPTDPNNNPVAIVGETPTDFSICGAPFPYNPPSYTNINPFIMNAGLSWDITSGLNWTLNSMVIHASNNANSTITPMVNYDHRPILNGYRHNMENETRLYTFACRYDDGTPDGSISLIYPKVRPSNANYLNTKFMTTDANGHEPDCAYEWNCQPSFVSEGLFSSTFSIRYETAAAHPHNPLANGNAPSQQDNCQNGSYRTTAVESLATAEDIKLYPNPTSGELTIELPQSLKADDAFSFTLADITGKTVHTVTTFEAGSKFLQLDLSAFTPGMYMGTVDVNGVSHTHKVIIK